MPNSVSEWFGYRVFPSPCGAPAARFAQQNATCPFLTDILHSGEPVKCVKGANSRGVCTIGSDSNGEMQDWVVCPYRTISSPLLADAARLLFSSVTDQELMLFPAPRLAAIETRNLVRQHIGAGRQCVIFFMDKLGGEIDLPGTPRSPKFKLDAAMVELVPRNGGFGLGRFGIVEVQTMDFHGTYRHATRRLTNALELHPSDFPAQLAAHPEWAAEAIEGPNIANVFKRTIYQLLFKLRLGQGPDGAGCVMAIPQAVWESWQPHLAAPSPTRLSDGTASLLSAAAGTSLIASQGWLLIFDTDRNSPQSPNSIQVRERIRVDVEGLTRLAFNEAPAAALDEIGGDDGLKSILTRRIRKFWDEISA